MTQGVPLIPSCCRNDATRLSITSDLPKLVVFDGPHINASIDKQSASLELMRPFNTSSNL